MEHGAAGYFSFDGRIVDENVILLQSQIRHSKPIAGLLILVSDHAKIQSSPGQRREVTSNMELSLECC